MKRFLMVLIFGFMVVACSSKKEVVDTLPSLKIGDCLTAGSWKNLGTQQTDSSFDKYYMKITSVQEMSFSFVLKAYSSKNPDPDGEMSTLKSKLAESKPIPCPVVAKNKTKQKEIL